MKMCKPDVQSHLYLGAELLHSRKVCSFLAYEHNQTAGQATVGPRQCSSIIYFSVPVGLEVASEETLERKMKLCEEALGKLY